MLGALALTIGLTTIAQGAQVETAGALALIIELVFALGGGYVALAGLWGGWLPGTTRARVRTVRVLLSWVVLTSAVFCLALPLGARATMTRAEWISLVSLAAYVVIALTAIRGIVRMPGLTVVLLGLAAAYSAVALGFLLRDLVVPGKYPLTGPPAAFAFALSASVMIGNIAAFWLAWPLRPASATRRQLEI